MLWFIAPLYLYNFFTLLVVKATSLNLYSGNRIGVRITTDSGVFFKEGETNSAMYYTPANYVRLYMEAYRNGLSYSEAALEMGISRQSFYQRKRYLQGKGVRLPELGNMQPGAVPLQVPKLNDIIDSYKEET